MLKIRSRSILFLFILVTMVMNKLIEPELKPVPPRGDIFVLYCCHCLQQKLPNQNSLFARIFIGLTTAETEGFCRALKLDLLTDLKLCGHISFRLQERYMPFSEGKQSFLKR